MEKINIKNNYLTLTLISGFSLISLGLLCYRNYCHHHTFKKINDNFKQKKQWEKELNIYSISMPKFFVNGVKKTKMCIVNRRI